MKVLMEYSTVLLVKSSAMPIESRYKLNSVVRIYKINVNLKACAITLVDDSVDVNAKGLAELTYCMFKNREFSDIYALAPHCVNQNLFDEWTDIDLCEQNTTQISQIFEQLKAQTSSVSLVNGLAVQIGSTVDPNNVNNLVKAICDAYEPEVSF